LQKNAIISAPITVKTVAIFAFFAIANIAMRFVSIHFIMVPTFAPSTISRVGGAAVIVSLDGRAREKRTANAITKQQTPKTTSIMININALIEQGGSVKLEVRPEDLVLFAESIVERMEMARLKEIEEGKAKEAETFLSMKEAREMLNVCDGTLITWAKRGYLVPHKLGNKNRYALSDVKRILCGEKGESVTAYCKSKFHKP